MLLQGWQNSVFKSATCPLRNRILRLTEGSLRNRVDPRRYRILGWSDRDEHDARHDETIYDTRETFLNTVISWIQSYSTDCRLLPIAINWVGSTAAAAWALTVVATSLFSDCMGTELKTRGTTVIREYSLETMNIDGVSTEHQCYNYLHIK